MDDKALEYNIFKSIKAQKEYCEEKKYPHFAPHDGRCYRCRENIYKLIEHTNTNGTKYKTGIPVEKASSELITGCPHCNSTYCD